MKKKINKNPKRINKKAIIAVVAAVVAIVGGIAAFSAYEAHVINVTAHIENALSVETTPIEFGTVFPQEYLEKQFTINLSSSFLAEGNVDDVEYVINQKPKCKCDYNPTPCPLGEYAPVDYATHQCPIGYHEMLSLCPFLSKTDGDPEDNNDTGVPSYYQGTSCVTPDPDYATGRLAKSEQDVSDVWLIDLKVPPVAGYVGQDWPAGCPVVDEDSRDYGCDLWIEVTGISRGGEENGSEQERACIASGGTVATGLCCLATGDFPDTCSIGACGCAPQDSHEVQICDCGSGRCFDGSTCVDECTPTAEVCDNQVDDDCDGDVDCDDSDCSGDAACQTTECTGSETRSCYTGDISTQGVGLCHSGTETCVGDYWSGVCVGEVTPVAEICDGQDNDCDGQTDEGDVCQSNNWTYEQNFNSLSDGDLNGQDGWTGSDRFDVQTAVKYEGIKGVQIVNPGTTYEISRVFTAIDSGTVYVAIRKTNTSASNAMVKLYESGGEKMAVALTNGGQAAIWDGGTNSWLNITSFNADQWYVFAIEFDDTGHSNQYRARVHNGTSWSAWSSWVSVISGSYNEILGIRFVADIGTNTVYYDIVTPNDPTP